VSELKTELVCPTGMRESILEQLLCLQVMRITNQGEEELVIKVCY